MRTTATVSNDAAAPRTSLRIVAAALRANAEELCFAAAAAAAAEVAVDAEEQNNYAEAAVAAEA